MGIAIPKRLLVMLVGIALVSGMMPAFVFPVKAEAAELQAATIQTGELSTQALRTTRLLIPVDGLKADLKYMDKYAERVKYKKKYKFYFYNKGAFLSFKAPKTGTYSFTFSGLCSKYSSKLCAGAVIFSDSETRLLNVRTKGGTSNSLYLGDKGLPKAIIDAFEEKKPIIDVPYRTRTGKVKLKKGQTIYMSLMSSDGETGSFSYINLKVS